MAFEPDKITKKHVLEAVQYIENEKIDLISPTKYYIVIDGKRYPAKEVMRYAHQQMNGEKIWRRRVVK